MITNPRLLGLLAVAFAAGAFIASPELRAYAANTVFSTDIVDGQVMTADLANNAVTAAKVKDGEIRAAEIATDAVGAAELQGVTKILFGQCLFTAEEGAKTIPPGDGFIKICNISGVDIDDSASATLNDNSPCVEISKVSPDAGKVYVQIRNDCSANSYVGFGASIAVIVYDK